MRKWTVSSIVAVLVAILVAGSSVYAAVTPAPTPTPANGSAGQGLEISPPVIELSANPGQTVTTNIRVRNVTKGELIAKGKADDFGASDSEDGKPKLLLDETGATRYSLKFWVDSVPDLRLAPGELKTNTIKIVVPANAEPGGHFGVVRFTAVPPSLEGTGVALSASIGALVLLRVNGTVTEKVSLEEFTSGTRVSPELFKKQSFFEHGPVDFLVRVHNEGSVHEKVKGTIDVTSWTGKKVATIAVNGNGGNTLPDSVRKFDQRFGTKQLLGHYTGKLALTYTNGKTLTGKIGFWVIPWKLLLLGLIGLIVLGFLLRIAIRRYNDHIVAQSRRR